MPGLQASAASRVVDFARALRDHGFIIGPNEVADALALVARSEPDAARIRARLKSLLATSREDWNRFDALFDAFWLSVFSRPAAEGEISASVIAPASTDAGSRTRLDEGERGSEIEMSEPGEGEDGGSGASAEALARIDIAEMSDPADLARARRIARRLAAAMRKRLSRRLRATSRGQHVDLRRTIRRSLAHGGEVVDLSFKTRRRLPLPVYVLLDVSGSMNAYTGLFLTFVHALAGRWSGTHMKLQVHLMHTDLVDATEALKERDHERALARVAEISTGIGGGTRLGRCLAEFNRTHARRSALRRAVVIVLSDGYDSGPEVAFETEFAKLAGTARRMVWLNPLKGRAAYRPVTLAMMAALPHIDHFAAANTLASLAALEGELASLAR